MSITLTDAIRRVRSEIDEPASPTLPNPPANPPTAGFYTDTEITDWINAGLRDLARRCEVLYTVDQSISIPAFVPSSITPGPPTYALLSDVVRLHRVEFVPTGSTNQIYRLEASTRNEMDQIWGTYQQNTSSYPRWYVTSGRPGGSTSTRDAFTIQLYPCPSQSGTLNIYYYRTPTRIGDPVATNSNYNVVLDVNEGWDDIVVDFAVYKALQKQRAPEWKDRKAEYEEKVEQMVDVTRRYHDQQSFISYGTNMMPSWLVGGGEW